jgi:hypothetical protein
VSGIINTAQTKNAQFVNQSKLPKIVK